MAFKLILLFRHKRIIFPGSFDTRNRTAPQIAPILKSTKLMPQYLLLSFYFNFCSFFFGSSIALIVQKY